VSNPNGKKGTAWETAVEGFLAVLGVTRQPKRGAKDESDLHTAYWALECKNLARVELAQFADEAEEERANAGKRFGAAVIKRRRSPGSPGTVETGYVLMSLAIFREQEAHRLELAARCTELEMTVRVLRGELHGPADRREVAV
jgi:hypothetical protein